MRVATEAVVERAKLLMQHGVAHHTELEFGALLLVRQLAVQEQVADLEEVRLLGQLLDRITTIQQDAFIAVDVGDLAVARSGGSVAGIVSEDAKIRVQFADVEHRWSDGAVDHRQAARLVGSFKGDGDGPFGRAAHARVLVSWRGWCLPLSACPRAAPGGKLWRTVTA